MCTECTPYCNVCVTGAICTECDFNFTHKSDDNTCFCPVGKFLSSPNCYNCGSTCSTCEISLNRCLTCSSNYLKEDNGFTCSCKKHKNYVDRGGVCVCPLDCGYYLNGTDCLPCYCSDYKEGECGNCECSLMTLDYTIIQKKEGCPNL